MNEAELCACLAGLYIGITLQQSIILETDCAFFRSFLANEKLDRSPLIDLKKEDLSICRMFKNFKIVKINQLANGIAHKIAKFSFISRSDGILLNSAPSCVANFVMNDCNNLFN